eukprot:2945655-Pyramimonas_sp.AAC.1
MDFIMHAGAHGRGPAGLLLDATDCPMGPPGSGPLYLSRHVAEGMAEASASRPPSAESLGTSAMDDRSSFAGLKTSAGALSAFVVVTDLGDKIDFRSHAPLSV